MAMSAEERQSGDDANPRAVLLRTISGATQVTQALTGQSLVLCRTWRRSAEEPPVARSADERQSEDDANSEQCLLCAPYQATFACGCALRSLRL